MVKHILKFTDKQLNLRNTLINGQCFNWTAQAPNLFVGVLFQHYMEISRVDSDNIQIEVFPDGQKNMEQQLYRYFNQSVRLEAIASDWLKNDRRFAQVYQRLPGIRILRQQPWECTISFICSSNNNISRITKMLNGLRSQYGKFIKKAHNTQFYTFPTVHELAQAKPEEMKKMGFGYRADYITAAVDYIKQKGGQQWLEDLRAQKYEIIKEQLQNLKGVGRKVADCISLFSMDCHQAVPVDTHMFQLAKKYGYIQQKHDKKSMSDTLYYRIWKCYVDSFGQYAGWAQQILFAGDLVMFKQQMQEQVEGEPTKPIKYKSK